MQDEMKRFVRIAIIICALAIILVVALTDNIKHLLYLISLSTLMFLPVALLMLKYKSLWLKAKNSKYSQIAAVIGLLLGTVVSNYLSTVYKICLVVFGFEILCLYYALYTKHKRCD